MSRAQYFEPEFVIAVPETLNEGVLYISMPFATAIHLCACGCRSEIVTPLRPGQWRMIFDGTITIRPSIGNWSFPCRSHYFIDRNRVVWAPTWSDVDVAHQRQAPQRTAKSPRWPDWFTRLFGR